MKLSENSSNNLLHVLAGIMIGVFITGGILSFIAYQKEQQLKEKLKDYQIIAELNYIYLYDNGDLIGRCTYANTALDSLLLKDNQ